MARNNANSFSLPSGFTEIEYADGSDYTREVLGDLNDNDAEVWLIKAPLGADLKALNGQKLKLDRRSLCKCENGAGLKYEIEHNTSVPKELKSSILMIPDFDSGVLKPCHTRISGFLSISETVTLPETIYPSVVESKVPFPSDLKLRYVPFGAVSPRKKKSKKAKYKESSDREDQITKELLVHSKKKKVRHEDSSVDDSDGTLQTKQVLALPTNKKIKKRKTSSEDECDTAVKNSKRAKIDKSCENVVSIKKEILSPVRKMKKSKTKQSVTDDSDSSSSNHKTNGHSNNSRTSNKEKTKIKKHKKHKKEK